MISFPLLLIPLAIYNIIVLLMPGVAMTAAVKDLVLPSGATWSMSFADLLVALALVLLIAEMAKAVRPGKKSVVDHALALVLFAAALAEFLLLTPFASSTFFALVMIAFTDLAASLVVQSQRAAAVRAVVRRPPSGERQAEPPADEKLPRVAAAPAPAEPNQS